MTDARQYGALLKFVRVQDDPVGRVFLLLLDGLGTPIEKARLLQKSNLEIRTLERALHALVKNGLAKKLQCGAFAYYFAVV